MENIVNVIFAVFTHIWHDPWLDQEIKCEYRFRKPGQPEINRFNKEAAKTSSSAQQNLLVSTVHEEDKERLLADLNAYPALKVTIVGWLLKGSGLSGDLGN